MRKYQAIIAGALIIGVMILATTQLKTGSLKGDLLGIRGQAPVEIIPLNSAFIGEEYYPGYFDEHQNYYEKVDGILPASQAENSPGSFYNRLPEGIIALHGRINPLRGVSLEPGIFYFTLKLLDLNKIAVLDEQGHFIYKHFKIISRQSNADFNSDGTINQIDLIIYDEIMRSDQFKANNPGFSLSIQQREDLQRLYQQSSRTAPPQVY